MGDDENESGFNKVDALSSSNDASSSLLSLILLCTTMPTLESRLHSDAARQAETSSSVYLGLGISIKKRLSEMSL
jgi:hypothetical protein